jgi:hypothetical protein
MYGFEVMRAGRLAVMGALLLCGACGGDSGAGPGGGGNVEGNFDLTGINNTAVPAIVQTEDCSPVRFVSGTLTMGDGDWSMDVEMEDEDGPSFLQDHGGYEQDGSELGFQSVAFGDRFEGELEEGLVVLYYDYCSNGEHDVDLVFER